MRSASAMYSSAAAARGDGIPLGKIRVLLVGDAGVGKSAIAQLIADGAIAKDIQRTIGCSVLVKLFAYPTENSAQDFFVELWDVSGNEAYKDCRSIFYSQINGIIFVHDLSQRKTKSNLHKWATEVASLCTFTAPFQNAGLVPVPFLVVGNKADLAPKSGGSSSNLVDVARHWVEKQGLLSPTDELPTSETFPGGTKGLRAVAKTGELDMDAISDFFIALIKRRYFGEGNVLSTFRDAACVNFQSKQPSSMYNGSKSLSSSRYRV